MQEYIFKNVFFPFMINIFFVICVSSLVDHQIPLKEQFFGPIIVASRLIAGKPGIRKCECAVHLCNLSFILFYFLPIRSQLKFLRTHKKFRVVEDLFIEININNIHGKTQSVLDNQKRHLFFV